MAEWERIQECWDTLGRDRERGLRLFLTHGEPGRPADPARRGRHGPDHVGMGYTLVGAAVLVLALVFFLSTRKPRR